MEFLNLALLLHGLDYTVLLVPKVCVVVVGAFACIRLQRVRRALRGAETSWWHRLTMMLAFGGLGIFATHSGLLVNVDNNTVNLADWSAGILMNENQAIVGFRDTMVLAGGLIGGPWVGLGAGLMAGYERYLLGGFAALASGLATLMLGILAGWTRRRPHGATTPYGAFIVALFGTVLHRLSILFLAKSHPLTVPLSWESIVPDPLAVTLTWEIMLPVAIVNCLGCVLFIWVMRDLDRDKLEAEMCEAQLLKQEAQLRAWHAQVEPHFLNNTLNAIRSLIRIDPDKAREYVIKLAEFFESTRKSASANTIPLREELEQLERYLDFQQLRFGDKFHYLPADIPASQLDYLLPPRSLLTLAENALVHGMPRSAGEFVLRVATEDFGGSFALRVADNGCGIAPERLAKLGKAPVEPQNSHGNGTALHQLVRSLELTFSGRAGLAITSQLGGGTEVTLTLTKEQ